MFQYKPEALIFHIGVTLEAVGSSKTPVSQAPIEKHTEKLQ
jgi:hypothetical protein